ncbi:outer membrane efflux protein [Psychromonas sp. CNPT3]|uniref:TolC family protein n=1 Tax=Psychromonas sp. CNPT3 TaxID=314282 RepID=UPI00006E78D5|nr:outer membrane efflux protein [Psychromonas sp. CNPT3]
MQKMLKKHQQQPHVSVRKLYLLLPFFILLLPSFSQAQSMDLNQAWSQLLKVSDTLQAEQQSVKRAQAKNDATQDLGLPSLSLNANYTHLSDPLEFEASSLSSEGSPALVAGILQQIPNLALSEQDIFHASLQAMWPIYTGGKITAAQAISDAIVQEKEQQLQLAKHKLFLQLVDRYYALAVSEALESTQKKLLSSLQKHAHHAQKLEEHGQIAKVERLNADMALANAKLQYNNSVRQVEMANIALTRLLHITKINAVSDFVVSFDPLSLPNLLSITLSEHPALKLLKAKEAQAKSLIAVENSSYRPSVFLYANYTLYDDDSIISEMAPEWLVGVGLKVPLFSRDGRSGKVQAAKSAQLQARYTLAQTKQDLSLLVEHTYRQLLQAQEEMQSLQASMSLAQENKRLRDIAFRQGLSTSLEKVDAELKLSAVITQQLLAKYRYIQAYARLMSTSGQINLFIANSLLTEEKPS